VIEMGAGNYSGCALLEDGTVWCWGNHKKGSIGDGVGGDSATAPTRVVGLPGIVHIEIGPGSGAAISDDGSVFHWGLQAGPGEKLDAPVPWPALHGVARVRQHHLFGCALEASGGELRCFGLSNTPGLLGSATVGRAAAPGLRVPIPPVRAFSTGFMLTCAAVADGSLYCWGSAMMLSTGATPNWESPTKIAGLTGVTAVSCGLGSVCALREDRTVWCFGENDAGQLGDGTKISRYAPRPVVGLTDVAQVSRGENHTCAVTTQGALYCWGGNEKGQLGDGTLEGHTRPVRIDW